MSDERYLTIVVTASVPAGVPVGEFLQAVVDSYGVYIGEIQGTPVIGVNVRWLPDAHYVTSDEVKNDE